MSEHKKLALLSVSDKTGLVEFARELVGQDFSLLSSGGTAWHLKEHDIPVREVADFTGFPELFGGRIKTLHPRIHGGILARPKDEDDARQMEENHIDPISLVVVNLYPFEETAQRKAPWDELIENIDIGGPTLIRAAAKNYKNVLVVVNPTDYKSALDLLKKSSPEAEEGRLRLAVEAFSHTAYYDAVISSHFWKVRYGEEFPAQYALPVKKKMDLRYGENPHQKAALYADGMEENFLVSAETQLSGKQLSYNNILDADAALKMAVSFSEPAAVIVKHNNPCGVAVGTDLCDAYLKALSCDPVSAFGSIVACNREVDEKCALEMKKLFIEVLLAPEFSPQALQVLQEKKNLRLIKLDDMSLIGDIRDWRKVGGGFLSQDSDLAQIKREDCQVVTQTKPDENDWKGLLFAWSVVKHVKSNAIVFTNQTQTLGIGAGQMSRLDSVQCAVSKSNFELKGSYLASDAFFPFRDGVDKAAEYGVKAVIQPGGSKRDQEVIDACNEYGIAMVFTGVRHFKH